MGLRGTRSTLALLLATALTLTACSDDTTTTGKDDGATTTTPTTTTSSTTGAGTLERYADYRSTSYDDDAHWLCRPGRKDVCSGDLDVTVIEADGTTKVEPFRPAASPPIDCFYVYPTISRDPGTLSDWNASDDEEGYAAVNQVARLASQCRVFAPVYRQRTLASLANRLAGTEQADPATDEVPYTDVLDAWRTYMAEDNGGRGVVLVGHSQGSAVLSRLVKEEIETDRSTLDHLVAAYLAGWSVRVPEGKLVGGDFAKVPLCTKAAQSGCVVTWASFRDTAPPPPGAFFGKPRSGEGPAGCTNPAALGGGSAATRNVFPANRDASILTALKAGTSGLSAWVDPAVATVSTPFVALPGLVEAQCVSADGFDYLRLHVVPDPGPRADDIAGDLTPEWGMHLIDFNVVMGDVVDLVERQARAWAGS